MSRVLVTGASGFIGRHLIESLRGDIEVVAAIRDSSRMSVVHRPVEMLNFHLEEGLAPAELCGFDCVYHLAAHVHVMRPQAEDEERFQQLNVRATHALARSAAAAGVRRFVYLSSIKVNGERTQGTAFSERDAPAPKDAYGRSKLAAEQAILEVAAQSELEVVIVRPPLVYGPGVGANFRRLMSLVRRGWPLPFGGIHNRRSLVSVWNLASLLSHVLDNPDAAGHVWLVCDGEDISTPQLLRMIGAALDRPNIPLLPVPAGLLRAIGRLTLRGPEIARLTECLQVDMSNTVAHLGWRPKTTLEEGIRRTAKWYVEAHCDAG